MSDEKWFIRVQDQVVGPLPDADLRDRAMHGSVAAQTPVSNDGVNWVEAAAVAGIVFGSEFPPAVPPPLPTEPSLLPPIPVVWAPYAAKWQAIGRAALVRADKVTRNALIEGWAIICATVFLIWRAIKYGIALGYLRFLERGFHRSQLNLGEQMYRSNVGTATVRESIHALDEQIKEERVAKRSPSRLLANRRELLLRLAATSAVDDAAIKGPQRQEVRARQHELEEQHAAVKAIRAGLLPSSSIELRRAALGFGAIVAVIIAGSLYGQNRISRADRTAVESLPSPLEQQASKNLEIPERIIAQQFIAAALKDAPLILDAADKAQAFWTIALAQALAGDVEASRHNLKAASEAIAQLADATIRAHAYCDIAVIQAEVGDIEGARATASRLDEKDKAETYRGIAEAQAKMGDATGAKVTASQIRDEDAKASAYRGIAEVQATAGDVGGARGTAEQIQDEVRKTESFFAVSKTLAMAGDFSDASQFLTMTIAAAGQIKNPENQKAACFRVADDELKAAHAGEGWHESHDLNEHGVYKIRTILYVALSQAKAGNTEAACQTLKAASAAAQLGKNKYACIEIASTQMKFGDVEGAKVTATQINEPDDKADIYLTIAEAQMKARDVAGARQSLEIAGDAAARISSFRTTTHLGRVVVAQVKAGDVARAKATAAQLDPKAASAIYYEIALAQAEAGDLTGAKATATRIGETQRAFVYLKAGDIVDAKAAAAQLDGVWKADVNYESVVAQAKAGDITGAKATAAQLDGEWKAAASYEIAVAQMKAGDVAGAKLSVPQTDETWKAATYYAISEAHMQAGDVAAAIATAAQLSDGDAKAYTYFHIALCQAQSGDVAAACQNLKVASDAATRINTEIDKASTLRRIAGAQTQAGNIKGAEATVTQLSYGGQKAAAYCEIAEAQAKAGDIVTARRSLKDAVALAGSVVESNKAWAYRSIANLQVELGDIPEARVTVAQISDTAIKAYACHEIVVAQIQAGDVLGAKETVKQIGMKPRDMNHKELAISVLAYAEIAVAQAKAKNSEGAIQSAEEAVRLINAVEDDPRLKCKWAAEAALQLVSIPPATVPPALEVPDWTAPPSSSSASSDVRSWNYGEIVPVVEPSPPKPPSPRL